jgi:rubrerythrin
MRRRISTVEVDFSDAKHVASASSSASRARAEGEVSEENNMAGDKPTWWRCTSCDKEFAVTERKAPITVTHGSGKPTHCPFCGKDGLRDDGETEPDEIGPWR